MSTDTDARVEELRKNYQALQDRIAAACRAVGREPSEITAVVVTKTWPVEDARRLVALGVADLGENRDQDAKVKAEGCADLDVTWHFIGQLQRNKANSVARYADYVHSVDRVPLVKSLDAGADRAGRRLRFFVQISLDLIPPVHEGPVGHRGGARPVAVTYVCGAVADCENLELVGLMAVAPLGE